MSTCCSCVFLFVHQSFETTAPPHSGLGGAFTFYASKSEWSYRLPGTKVSGAFPHPYFSTHSTPFVNNLLLPSVTHWLKNTVGSHEINRLIFERPANKLVGDAKTVTSSEFPTYPGTKMKCMWSESSRNPLPRPECGGAGVSNDWCIRLSSNSTLKQSLKSSWRSREKCSAYPKTHISDVFFSPQVNFSAIALSGNIACKNFPTSSLDLEEVWAAIVCNVQIISALSTSLLA